MSDIKDCPWCGSSADGMELHGATQPVYQCSNSMCIMQMMNARFIEKTWNNRPIEDALRERIKVLERVAELAERTIAGVESLQTFYDALKAARSGET